MPKLNLSWDGEKVKQVITEDIKKHTPKELLNAVNQTRAQLAQMKAQKKQLEDQLKNIEKAILENTDVVTQLEVFEDKCNELQVAKLKAIIKQIHEECKNRANESATVTINKDRNAMTDNQKKNLYYVDYQRCLATHPKVATEISQHVITQFLYDTPIFENPFKVKGL